MKRVTVRILFLMATFTLSGAVSAIFTVQLAAPQSVIQQCRKGCGSQLRECLNKAQEDERTKQRCYARHRQCLDRCTPKVSPGE